MPKPKRAILALEDGRIFDGTPFGCEGEAVGEVVFNTGMTGYQEILTDPSYKGQIVTMTYPLIGNYGVNPVDVESSRPQAEGFVIKELASLRSNYRSQEDLGAYLRRHRIVGIQGIDTRALTRHIRNEGAQMGVISSRETNARRLVEKARRAPPLVGRDLVKEVTCRRAYDWTEAVPDVFSEEPTPPPQARYEVVVVDCGVKRNILRCLVRAGCRVRVVPARTKAKAILARRPDAVLLSNGPGDPEAVPYVIETTRQLLGRVPVMGICLGHQILGLALGARTYKLKFGHHGCNHPVKDVEADQVAITSQNHGFCVDLDTIGDELDVTHVNLNDDTLEGMRHRSLPAISVQYDPEAGPGPHDAEPLFDGFLKFCREAAG